MLLGEKMQSVRDYIQSAKDELSKGNQAAGLLKCGVAMGIITTIDTASGTVREFVDTKLSEVKSIALVCGGVR